MPSRFSYRHDHDLVGTVHTHVGVPHPADFSAQYRITLAASTAQLRVVLPCCMTPIC